MSDHLERGCAIEARIARLLWEARDSVIYLAGFDYEPFEGVLFDIMSARSLVGRFKKTVPIFFRPGKMTTPYIGDAYHDKGWANSVIWGAFQPDLLKFEAVPNTNRFTLKVIEIKSRSARLEVSRSSRLLSLVFLLFLPACF
jgi:hypothetical protein